MSVIVTQATAKNVFDTARMFLNDENIQLWTDTILFPMMNQAHLELQAKLKSRAAPIMKSYVFLPVPAGSVVIPQQPADLTSPIFIWEKPQGAPDSAYIPMTETDILPFTTIPGTKLVYWSWAQEVISFIGSTIAQEISLEYWRRVSVPTTSTDPIEIIDGEQYLAPRIAAIAAGSVGEENTSQVCSALAEAQLQIVLSANRSRAMPQNSGVSSHP